jgi:excisionase family DNA binding protein
MQSLELPPAGYTIREAEALLGVSEKYLYKLNQKGEVEGYVDSVGQQRVSREAIYAYIKSLVNR